MTPEDQGVFDSFIALDFTENYKCILIDIIKKDTRERTIASSDESLKKLQLSLLEDEENITKLVYIVDYL